MQYSLRLSLSLVVAALWPVPHAWAATFTVTTTANSGAGSLHQAILDANASPGADVIEFNIGAAGKTITPPFTAPLPTITEALTIDGATQPGFAGVPLIELSGSSGPSGSDGLKLAASDCVIRGLVVNRWKGDGIEIEGGARNVVEGCYLGVSLNGAADQGNSLNGVFINGSSGNRIGGPQAAQRNVISGNEDHGVFVQGAASAGNLIQGNIIGLNASGLGVLRNTDHGILVDGAVDTAIGGAGGGIGNVISGNGQRGISVAGAGTLIQGNVIGLDINAAADLGNAQDGIHVAGVPGTVIGGRAAGASNIISGNNGDGVEVNGAGAMGTVIEGNFIGVRGAGDAAVANSIHGVVINGAVDTRVGGALEGARNVISGNSQHGIALAGATAAGAVIQGNFIGLDLTGSIDVGNGQDGVNISAVAGSLIGGPSVLARNLISGNNGDGIELTGAATQNTVIEGNDIGLDRTGLAGVANGGAGVLIAGAAARNRVGGVGAGQANRVAFNTGDGVAISGGPENTVRGNSIHSNGGLGIDLGGNGVQPNDATDTDTGANLLQNFPVLTEAVLRAAATEVTGTLQSTANSAFTLDFYGNDLGDPSGNGEGQTWIGSGEVTTDAAGLGSFTASLAATTQRFISATATDPAGNTSEFSATRRAVTTATPADFLVTTTADSGAGSLRQAILDANAALNEGDRIVFNIPGDGAHTIAPVTALPALAAPVTIDGHTQPGAAANTLAEGFNATLKVTLDGNAAPSGTDGLRVEAPRVTVRGLALTRWKSEGIEIMSTASAAVLEGNVIGLGLDGSDQGQNSHGVLVGGAAGIRIGGPAPSQRNVISGNNNHGIFINGAAARNNVIQGNFLGTDLTGAARVGNTGDGVHVTFGSANRIGGGGVGEGNVIGGNNGEGVELENANANVVAGNRVGVAFNGAEIRNSGHGLQLNNASDTLIGGGLAGEGNVIARNTGRGITLLNTASQRNYIRGNSIFANGNLGVDLFNNGRTLNDAGDADAGPNGLQNFPELAAAVGAAASTRVTGALNASANTAFTLEFFANREADSTGFGEGEQFLGSADVATGADGNAAFDVTVPTRVLGRFITATATGPEGTSEFSAALRATATIPPLAFTVTTTADSGPGSLRQALLDADQVVTGPPHRIAFAIPGDGPHTISPATLLPALVNEPVEIDGFTQPGAAPNTLVDGFNAVHRIVLDGAALPFAGTGLRFDTAGNVARGLAIVKFQTEGLLITGNDNVVEGCLIGLLPNGTARSNTRGVRLQGAATRNRLGGATAAARNIIAGNTAFNVEILSATGANTLLGNFIGVLPSGIAAPPIGADFSGTTSGVLVQGSPDNVIGGAEPGAGNVIGGHFGSGVEVRDPGAARNRVLGNRIGTDTTGRLPVPNQLGVWVVNGPGTVIGGPGPGEGNRVAFNLQHGVAINGFSHENDNPVRGNSISENGALGLNLGSDTVLENDAGDTDATANRGQNFPVLTGASAAAGSTAIQGTLHSASERTFTLDFFANVACDSSGNGEGDQYLGSTTVATGTDGNAAFNVTFPITVVGRFITATATDPDGNTSEFCDCFEATTAFGSETFVVTNTDDDGPGSLREALRRNNASVAGSANRIEFAISGVGPHVITPAVALPAVTHAVAIDGYSQPGSRANTLANGGDAALNIHLEAGANFGGPGLELNSTGSVVRGLAITKWFIAVEVNGGQNTIQGCFIGLKPDGGAGGALNGIGLHLASGNGHRVGGAAPGDRNIISGNNAGLLVNGNGSVIEGNWFGLDPTGLLPRGNSQPIDISGDNHRFGGAEAGARNIVAASGGDGLRLPNANQCVVAHNYIGVDVTGLVAVGNAGVGIQVPGGSSGIQILGNVIGGNAGAGVQSFRDSVILGNLIGVGADSTTPLPNAMGVVLTGFDNRVGGPGAGEGNIIAHNVGDGVAVLDGEASGNSIRGNMIFANGNLGVNLGFDGATPNDVGDGDSGPNGLQNFPELASATVHNSAVEVAGSLNSAPNAAFTLDFYASHSPDISGFGEGRQYLGSATANTGADGRAEFNATLAIAPVGRWITATATDSQDNTSEFSAALRAASTRPPETIVVVTTAEDGPGSLADALRLAGTKFSAGPTRIRFNIPGAGIRTIFLTKALPVVDEPVDIDGFSQPDAAENTQVDRIVAAWLVELDGSGALPGTDGLRFTRRGNVVRGLSIRNFPGAGIHLDGGGDNTVTGCVIVGCRGDGIRGAQSSGNLVGGVAPRAWNLIARNPSAGVSFTGPGSVGNRIQGNFIGVAADRSTPAGNFLGVALAGAVGNEVGAIDPGAGNTIAFNETSGVVVSGAGAGNAIRGNRFFGNGALAIDLGGFGVSPNDAGDADAGPNGLQNFPVLTGAAAVVSGARVRGALNSLPNRTYHIDFHHTATCDGAGHGEGAAPLGFLDLATDSSGAAVFDVVLPAGVGRGVITATATDPDGNTSEFSQCREISSEIPGRTFLVTTTADSGPGSLRQAILDANAAFTMDLNTVAFGLPGPGVQLIQPLSPLPAITQRVKVDGFTQPGAAPDPSGLTLNHVLLVRIDGALAGVDANGFIVSGPDVRIRGLIITRFAKAGVLLQNADRAVVEGNWIGTDGSNGAAPNSMGGALKGRAATAAGFGDPSLLEFGNGTGLQINGGLDLRIGTAGGNDNFGIVISGNGTGVEIGGGGQALFGGSIIGLDPAGQRFLGNNGNGVTVRDASAGFDNCTVSGNTGVGLFATSADPFSAHNDLTVQDSSIGLNRTKTEARGNGGGGLWSDQFGQSSTVLIRDSTISGNQRNGAKVSGPTGAFDLFDSSFGSSGDRQMAIPNSGPGLLVDGARNLDVADNLFIGDPGIHSLQGGEGRVLHNTFRDASGFDVGAAGPGGEPVGLPVVLFAEIVNGQVQFTGFSELPVEIVLFVASIQAAGGPTIAPHGRSGEPNFFTPDQNGNVAGQVPAPPGVPVVGIAFESPFGENSEIHPIGEIPVRFDFGDAPDSYGTTLAADGARHRVNDGPAISFGKRPDSEADGSPGDTATGDDNAGADEGGVQFLMPLVIGSESRIRLYVISYLNLDINEVQDGFVNGWIDFNKNGQFDDPDERVIDELRVQGLSEVTVAIPTDAVPGSTYARFRIRATEPPGSAPEPPRPRGESPTGEVEDYAIELIRHFDFGDAPDSYGTTLAANGARHLRPTDSRQTIALGGKADTEADGTPSTDALGDGADEDGVTFAEPLTRGTVASVVVNALSLLSAESISAWIDFNRDGRFNDPEERVLTDVPGAASQVYRIPIPANAVLGGTFARFRISAQTGLGPLGEAPDGEVEDYAVEITAGGAPADFNVGFVELPQAPVPANVPFDFTVEIRNAGPNSGEGILILRLPPNMGIMSQPDACEPLPPDGQWQVNAYLELLGRSPTEAEYSTGLQEIVDTGGRAATAGRLLDSTEYRAAQVQKLFFALLGRAATGPEEAAGREVLAQGTGLVGVARNLLRDVVFPDGGQASVRLAVEHARALRDRIAPLDVFSQLDDFFDINAYLEGALTSDLARIWAPRPSIEELIGLQGGHSVLACDLPEVASGGAVTLPFRVNPLFGGVHALLAEFRLSLPIDPLPENNIFEALVRVLGPKDYGDAPDAPSLLFFSIPGGYPTLSAANGARHERDPRLGLGPLTDLELDGFPSPTANAHQDDDGIVVLGPQVPSFFGPVVSLGLAGELGKVMVEARVPADKRAKLNVWVDFNRDGDWDDPSERPVANQPIKAGATLFEFPLPGDLSPGFTISRFRLSTADLAAPTGGADDGEVEDHRVLLGGVDRGDAPALFGSAPHVRPLDSDAFLGAGVDSDPVQPSADARADDTDADGDDEDGVTGIGPFFAGVVSSLVVAASEPGFVDLWLDYNGANGFELAPAAPDPTEYVNAGILGLPAGSPPAPFPVVKGPNLIRFLVPDRLMAQLSFLRVRYTTKAIPGLGPMNLAPDGEVEDYRVQLYPLAPDFGDAPDALDTPRYPTLRANNGAFHLVTEDRFFLGQRVDVEPDGFPSPDAQGDDLDNGLENPANPEPDDEEGVRFLTPLAPGQPASVQLVVTLQNPGPAFVNAWVDFNADFDWSDPGEQVLVNTPVVDGPNVVSIAVPAGARPGNTFARFRLTRDQGIGFAGPATSGEVEDHMVVITEPAGELRIGSILKVGGEVEVRWDGHAGVRLESAPTVNGPWTPLPATSPLRLSTGGVNALFLRLVAP